MRAPLRRSLTATISPTCGAPQPNFTWAEHSEMLLRRRKAWYYVREPRPGVTVIGDRLNELAADGRW